MNPPSFASSATLARASGGRAWNLRFAAVRLLLGWLPSVTFSRTRRIALIACGIRMGRATIFLGMPRLQGRTSFASRLHIGAHCGFNDGVTFDLAAPVTIGDYVWVGHEARFLTSMDGEHRPVIAPITIGNGAWLGSRCTVLAGVTIGAGSVIGAGATVAADVPPNTLLVGTRSIPLPTWG